MSESLNKNNAVKPTETLEVEELTCPLPLLKIKRSLAKLFQGDVLQVNGVHTSFVFEIQSWCERKGNLFFKEKSDNLYKYIYIKKG